jgi:protein-S-isoprenylcysteine O-methyltransferase Ste14
MTADDLFLRRLVVFLSAVVYWAGVWVQARRVRKRIGRSPNLKPRGGKEKLLWGGWFFVIAIWMGQPLWLGSTKLSPGLQLFEPARHTITLVLGLLLVVAGYVCTLWCYAAMGNTWRIGINRKEKNSLITQGPYRSVRHPIYLFQVVMLAGVALLLPTALSAVILLVHLVCVLIKSNDEEVYLRSVHGQAYHDYLSRTGRLLPKLVKQ